MRRESIYVLMLAVVLFAGSAVISACGSGQKSEATEEVATEELPAEDSAEGEELAYACPMHPEITGKEGDKCSKCGMDLEPVAEEGPDSTEVSED